MASLTWKQLMSKMCCTGYRAFLICHPLSKFWCVDCWIAVDHHLLRPHSLRVKKVAAWLEVFLKQLSILRPVSRKHVLKECALFKICQDLQVWELRRKSSALSHHYEDFSVTCPCTASTCLTVSFIGLYLHATTVANLWYVVAVGALLWRAGCFGAARCWAEQTVPCPLHLHCTAAEKIAQLFWFHASDWGFLYLHTFWDTHQKLFSWGGRVLRSGRGQLRETGSTFTAPPATSRSTFPRQHRPKDLSILQRDIHLIEIKYCEDTRPQNQLSAAQELHKGLCSILHGASITLHTIHLGVGGTVYNNHTLEPLKLGLDSQRVKNVLPSFMFILITLPNQTYSF